MFKCEIHLPPFVCLCWCYISPSQQFFIFCLFVCLRWFFTSQLTIFYSCRYNFQPSWVEPEDKVSCLRTQCSASGEARNSDLSVTRQALYLLPSRYHSVFRGKLQIESARMLTALIFILSQWYRLKSINYFKREHAQTQFWSNFENTKCCGYTEY